MVNAGWKTTQSDRSARAQCERKRAPLDENGAKKRSDLSPPFASVVRAAKDRTVKPSRGAVAVAVAVAWAGGGGGGGGSGGGGGGSGGGGGGSGGGGAFSCCPEEGDSG